jgi:formiminotetrahydrofolate cyclodeaminase
MIADQSVGSYLDRLASSDPTPGGGAAGAVHAAQAAALIGMVARFTTGAKYAAYESEVAEIEAAAGRQQAQSLDLADADEEAFQTVISAYRLPRGSEQEKTERSRAIQDALVTAAGPPRDLVTAAASVVALGERLAGFANPNVISDVAAAAEAARAAAATARVNLEINLAGLADGVHVKALQQSVVEADQVIAAAEALAGRVREQISR